MTAAVAERKSDQVAALPSEAGALMKLIERVATDPQFDVAKLKELLDVRERWESSEARKAFNVAFTAFKAEAIEIIKNRQVTDGPLKNKRYAELFSVVNAVTPALSRHGLSASWRLSKDEPQWIEVTCTVRHVLGHAESVSMAGPPDAGGAKNAIQARASTVSYLERYTLKAICGVAEQGDDNDGAGNEGRLDENVYADHLAAIDGADAETLQKVFGRAWKTAEDVNDVRAMRKFGERKEARKKALGLK